MNTSRRHEDKQTLLDQLRALAADDPDFFTDLLSKNLPHDWKEQRCFRCFAA
jgi:hypothetical protein